VRTFLPAPQEAGGTAVAGEATGLAPGAIRPVFGTRAQDGEEGFTGRPWQQGTVTMPPVARRGPDHEDATCRPVLAVASQQGPWGAGWPPRLAIGKALTRASGLTRRLTASAPSTVARLPGS
jgi:hypothetical protein